MSEVPQISEAAIQAIIGWEVTSPAVYQAALSRPAWPGDDSGVTIGVGYDLGYTGLAQFHADWDGRLPSAVVTRLGQVVGVIGAKAQIAARALHDVTVPWSAAEPVFRLRTLGEQAVLTNHTFPNCDALSADSFGALVSLIYNRGPSLVGPRRIEMAQIRNAMSQRAFAAVPGLLRAMKRLWTDGLVERREGEARLFEAGLGAQAVPPNLQV